MLTVRRPNRAQIDTFLADRAGDPLSYSHAGATRTGAPEGFNLDHNRIRLGAGEAAFTRAAAAITRWAMFDIAWVTLCWPSAPIAAGQTVAVLVPLCGFRGRGTRWHGWACHWAARCSGALPALRSRRWFARRGDKLRG